MDDNKNNTMNLFIQLKLHWKTIITLPSIKIDLLCSIKLFQLSSFMPHINDELLHYNHTFILIIELFSLF